MFFLLRNIKIHYVLIVKIKVNDKTNELTYVPTHTHPKYITRTHLK